MTASTRDKKKLFFHIGTPKTGTTSIQRALRLLGGLSGSYTYPEPKVTESHLLESAILLRDSGYDVDLSWAPEVQESLNNSADIKANKIISNLLGANSSGSTFSRNNQGVPLILSCEYFCKCISKVKTLKNLHSLLAPFDTTFVLYLRRIDLHCNSEVFQALKEGFWRKNDSLLDLKEKRRRALIDFHLNICKTLRNIQQIFGEKSIIVRPFEKQSLFKGDVVLDFMKVIGINEDIAYSDTIQNKTPPIDFLLYFSDLFGGPFERSSTAHQIYRKIYEGDKVYHFITSETKFVYSYTERVQMIDAVLPAYQVLNDILCKQGDSFFREPPPSHDDCHFNGKLSGERINNFNAIIVKELAKAINLGNA